MFAFYIECQFSDGSRFSVIINRCHSKDPPEEFLRWFMDLIEDDGPEIRPYDMNGPRVQLLARASAPSKQMFIELQANKYLDIFE